jgi:integrase
MKTRHQNGHLYRKGGYWYVRVRQHEIGPDGRLVRMQRAQRLASVSEYKSKRSVEELREEKLRQLRLNSTKYNPKSTMTLSQFADSYFFPVHVAQLKPSVRQPYECNWRKHLKPYCGNVRLRDFRTSTGQQVIDEAARRGIGRNTVKRLKSLLSGIFSEAIRLGVLDTGNPIREVRVPSLKGNGSAETHAYSLPQVSKMLLNTIGPARTVIAVFAFTGLRKGEVEALKWENWHGGLLWIEQSSWRGQLTEPKSERSKASVSVIAPLGKILEEHRAGKTEGLMFQSKKGTPLNLDNFARRTIKPLLKKLEVPWYGWHAFRRGLATNLSQLGVDPKDVQAILRHADFQTTMNHYVKSVPESVKKAMERFETLVCTKCAPESGIRLV